jgi:hypothetical protein
MRKTPNNNGVKPCGSCKNRRFRVTQRLHHRDEKNRWTRNVVHSSPILVTLMMDALSSSETSFFTSVTLRNIPEDAIFQSPSWKPQILQQWWLSSHKDRNVQALTSEKLRQSDKAPSLKATAVCRIMDHKFSEGSKSMWGIQQNRRGRNTVR